MSDHAAELAPEREHDAPRIQPHEFLLGLARRYGDIVRYRSRPEPAFLVGDPDTIRHILVDNRDNYSKATFSNLQFQAVVADGLLTVEGDVWKEQRRLIQPVFDPRRVARFGEAITAMADEVALGWEGAAAVGQPIDVADAMSTLTMRVAAKVLFGQNPQGMERLTPVLRDAITLYATPEAARFCEAKAAIQAFATDVVRGHRTASGSPDDLVGALVRTRDADDGARFSDEQIHDQVVTLLLAGFETTANALAWTWYQLALAPGVARRMRAEITAAFGHEPVTVDHLLDVPLVRMVLQESMRLYPPAWIIGRRALGHDRLSKVSVPAGAIIAISPFVLHRNPRLWPEPERFDPWRFERSAAAGRHAFAYLPFGAGPRRCIGHGLAMTEAILIVAAIARKYELRLQARRRIEPESAFVLRPRGGLPMRALRIGTVTTRPKIEVEPCADRE